MATNKIESLEKDTGIAVECMISKIGEHFEYCRKQKGLTLRALAKETRTSVAVISDFENGNKIPRFDTLVKLVLRLDIPFNEVFGNKFFPPPTFMISNNKENNKIKRNDDKMRSIFFDLGYTKKEVREILLFLDFIKTKRELLNNDND